MSRPGRFPRPITGRGRGIRGGVGVGVGNFRGAFSNSVGTRGKTTTTTDSTTWVSFPIKFDSLKKLVNDDKSDVEVLSEITSGGRFYASLNTSEKPPSDYVRVLLRILTKVTKVNTSLHRYSLHALLERALASKFFEWLQIDLLEVQWKLRPSSDRNDKATYEQLLRDAMSLVLEILNNMPGEVMRLMAIVTQIFNTLACDQIVALREEANDQVRQSMQLSEQQLRTVWHDLIEKTQSELSSQVPRSGREVRELEPLDNFRELPVFPREEDIMTLEKPRLRKNIVNGAYESVDHYLDIQFRLLREDFVWPIRDALTTLGEQMAVAQQDVKQPRMKEVKVYRGVTFTQPDIDKRSGLLVHELNFDIMPFKKVNWQTARRLLHGSLLCISGDNFKTVFFATVFGRNLEKIKRGIIEVYIDRMPTEGIKFNQTYSFIESPSFFEAYKHVLRALQNIRGPPHQDMPFERQLVFCDRNVLIPTYLLNNSTVNLSSLRHANASKNVSSIVSDVRLLETWPNCEHLALDQWQYQAVQQALTRQITIIQGPPGTGKTYVGLKIARVLLEHTKDVDDYGGDPMLVVCYTNHALDQFLEGIAAFMPAESQKWMQAFVSVQSSSLQKFFLTVFGPFQRSNLRTKLDDKKRYPMMDYCMQFWFGERTGLITTDKPRVYIINLDNLSVANDVKFIVRIGGAERMKEEMKQYQLRNFLENVTYKSKLFAALRDVRSQRSKVEREIQRLSKRLRGGLDTTLTAYDIMSVWKSANESLFGGPTHPPDLKKEAILCRWLCKFHRVDPTPTELHWKIAQELLNNFKSSPLICMLVARMFGSRIDKASKWIRDYELRLGSAIDEKLTSLEEVLLGLEISNNDIELTRIWLDINISTASNDDDSETTADTTSTNEQQSDHAIDEENGPIDECFQEILGNGRDYVDDYPYLVDEEGQFVTDSVLEKKKAETYLPHYVLKRLKNVEPLSDEQAEELAKHPWEIPIPTRWQLYRNWHQHWTSNSENRLFEWHAKYAKLTEELEEIRDKDTAIKLKGARVIAMTTTGAAKKQALLQQVRPKIVVIEEAAEILEAHIIASLTAGCQHLILIGDHKQLRPNPSVYELAKHYQLDVSLFERLINNGFNHVMLREQHRMRPEIADPLMKHFYTDLRNHSSVYNRSNLLGMVKNVFFISHSHRETDDNDSHSHKNMHEVKFVVALCKYLLSQGYAPDKITILTCYVAQMFEIKRLITNTVAVPVRVCVVDNFQGEENDIILLSLVRSNKEGKIGFLSIDNRVCVALSRAKLGLYVIGNFGQLTRQSELWKNIIGDLKNQQSFGTELQIRCQIHQTVRSVTSADDFRQMAPDGGCKEMCDIRLPCGHVCNRRCHPDDADHKLTRCAKKCPKTCPNKHPCPQLCYEDCRPCETKVDKKLPCGHQQMVKCWMPPEKAFCVTKCPNKLTCGHQCPLKCGDICNPSRCEKLVKKKLPCGHVAEVMCPRKDEPVNCQELVEKEWPWCQHENLIACSVVERMDNCPVKCQAKLKCGHGCGGTCGQCRNGRLNLPCQKPCDRVLVCGHLCTSTCSAPCPPCQKPCPNRCVHSSCGKVPGDKRANSKNRLCHERCPPCIEPCAWSCKHHKCELLCWEPCKRERCLQPCTKKLKCKHNCIGVCGEPCPRLCRECFPNQLRDRRVVSQVAGVLNEPALLYEQILKSQVVPISDEKKQSALFVQLESCNHIIEMTQLDALIDLQANNLKIDDDPAKICLLQCPICKALIRNCQRYGSVSKQLLVDLDEIKRQKLDEEQVTEVLRQNMLEKIYKERRKSDEHEIVAKMNDDFVQLLEQPTTVSRHFMARVEILHQIVKQMANTLENGHGIWLDKIADIDAFDEHWIAALSSDDGDLSYAITDFLRDLPLDPASSDVLFADLWLLVLEHVSSLNDWILKYGATANGQMIDEIVCEWRRGLLLDALINFVFDQKTLKVRWNNDEITKLEQILDTLYGATPINDELEETVQSVFRSLGCSVSTDGLKINNNKCVQLLKSWRSNEEHWLKCFNGHVYSVDGYNGYTEKSKCPKCPAITESQDDRYTSDNKLAKEPPCGTASASGSNSPYDKHLRKQIKMLKKVKL